MALIVPADFDSWLGKPIGAERQEELISAISFAQSWVGKAAGLRSIEKEEASNTTVLDGRDAYGSDLWLPGDLRPVWHTDDNPLTVTEDGVDVTVSSTYTSEVGVIVAGANTHRRVRLYKIGGWSCVGPQNIVVTCTVGWDPDPAATDLPVPHYVRRLVMEVAWLLFRSSSSSGQASQSKAGAAVTFEKELSPMAQSALDLLRGV